jgi:hypothetical protein
MWEPKFHTHTKQLAEMWFCVLIFTRASVFFFYGTYFSSIDFDAISVGQNVVCPVQFQPFLLLLDTSNGVFQSKVEKQWW